MLSISDRCGSAAARESSSHFCQASLFEDSEPTGDKVSAVSEEENKSFVELGMHWALARREIVKLHFVLLDECRKLADQETPLDEVIDILLWIRSEPGREASPFSFRNCVRLYSMAANPNLVREVIEELLPHWLNALAQRYPKWVWESLRTNPHWIAEQLQRNPQWVNESVHARGASGDLFLD
jgi:hypothetical protein